MRLIHLSIDYWISYKLLNLPGQVFSKSRMKLSSCRAFWRTELSRESALRWMRVRVYVCVRDWDGNSNTSPPPSSLHCSSSHPTLSGRAGIEKYKQKEQHFLYGHMTKWIHSCTTVCVCALFTPQILCYSWSQEVSDWSCRFPLVFTSWIFVPVISQNTS